MLVVLLAGCASQGEMVKIAGTQKTFAANTDNNFKVVAQALTGFDNRIKKLEAAKAEPVRGDKGQFTPAATNVPKTETAVKTPAPVEPVKE